MITPRDKKVIQAIGNHRVLSRKQIEYLFFPSYQTCQRRIREEYIPAKYISKPFYINVELSGNKKPLYRLEKEGKKKYKEYTGRKYYTPRWNINYLPHLVETNWILIMLKNVIDSFQLEKRKGAVQMDVYCHLKNELDVALEVDYSETETKKEIQRQYNNYEKLYIQSDKPDILAFCTDRPQKMFQWIQPEAQTDLRVLFVERTEQKISQLRRTLISQNRFKNHSQTTKTLNTTTVKEKPCFTR